MAALPVDSQVGEGPRPLSIHDLFEPGGDFLRGPISGDGLEPFSRALQRVPEAVPFVLVVTNGTSLVRRCSSMASSFC